MQITRYIAPIDTGAVLTRLGKLLELFAVLMIAPLCVALAARELVEGLIFLGLALSAYFLGRSALSLNRLELGVREALIVTALAYFLFAVLGAVAFLPVASFLDGFFEAMSGFTTTGLSVLDVQTLPRSLLFFRAYAQWIGGAGIIVLSLVVLQGPGKAAFHLYVSETNTENVVGNVLGTSRVVLKVYLALSLLGFLCFAAAGMDPSDAALHIMATVSTGGFSSFRESIGHYQSHTIEVCVAVFMILGAVSFPLYYFLVTEGPRRLFRDLQLRYLLAVVVLGTLAFQASFRQGGEAIFENLFRAASTTSTTGFGIVDGTAWPNEAKLTGILLMVLGGSAGSTAGGIKLFRLIIALRLASWALLRHLLPERAKFPIKYGDIVISDVELKLVFGFIVLYLFLLGASALFIIVAGFPVLDSVFESASALSTAGMSVGITSANLAPALKGLLILDMWLGRLEILPALIALYPGVWIRRRRPT